MGIWEKIKSTFIKEEYDEYDEYTEDIQDNISEYNRENQTDRDRYNLEDTRSISLSSQPKVVLASETRYELIVLKPDSIEAAHYASDILKENKTVVLNLTHLEDINLIQRIVDFTSGVVSALNGNIQKTSKGIYHLLPSVAKMSDESRERLNSYGLNHYSNSNNKIKVK